MAIPEGCPCDAVIELKENNKELQRILADHEKQLSNGNTNFALIKQDLEYIKGNLDSKKKFNTGIINTVVNTIITILLGYIAIRLGLS